MPEAINIGRIDYMYKSNNMFFFIAKEPTCLVSRNMMKKIVAKR